jgi:hypothetical protein
MSDLSFCPIEPADLGELIPKSRATSATDPS